MRADWSLPVNVCNEVMIISVTDALTLLTFTFRTASSGVQSCCLFSHICNFKMRQQGRGSLRARGGFFHVTCDPSVYFFIVIHLQLIVSPASVAPMGASLWLIQDYLMYGLCAGGCGCHGDGARFGGRRGVRFCAGAVCV